MNPMRSVMVFFAAAMLSGCTRSGVPVDGPPDGGAATNGGGLPLIAPAEMHPARDQQRQVALAAREELFQRLTGRLMEVLAGEGPAAAISVCKRDAPRLAVEVGEKHGVAIRRTSHRLRNPDNTPRDWARPLVDRRVDEPSFVALPEGGLGVLLPIRLQSACLLCHGPPEQILPEVQAALASQYPRDQATGFAEGELRGWFSIEVPAGAQPFEPPADEPSPAT